MKSRPLVACAFVVVLAACGKSETKPQAAVVIDAAPPIDASMGPAIVRPFKLATAKSLVPLPQKPAAYIFVTASGGMRVGAAPSFNDATEVGTVYELLEKVPPDPKLADAFANLTPSDTSDPPVAPSTADLLGAGDTTGTFGTASGGSIGFTYGVGAGGTYQAYSFSGQRQPATEARIVLVADRAASVDVVGAIMKATSDRVAVAVEGDDGTTGALPVVLSSSSAPAQYIVSVSSVGATVIDRVEGTQTQIPPGPNGMLEAATLRQSIDALYASRAGKDATVGLQLSTRTFHHELVAGLDATASGTKAVSVTVRGSSSGMRSRDFALPQVRIGQPSSVGDLDKAIIRRYIKRNIQKITYCYEKELLVKPGLQGTVTTQFVISPDGNVVSSKGDGMNQAVATCVAGVIHRIEFPKPKGGGIVQVSYPFTFRPAGG